MPKFEVIKAHDGIAEGTVRVLSASPITAKMVEKGYWRELEAEPAPKAIRTTAQKSSKKKSSKKK